MIKDLLYWRNNIGEANQTVPTTATQIKKPHLENGGSIRDFNLPPKEYPVPPDRIRHGRFLMIDNELTFVPQAELASHQIPNGWGTYEEIGQAIINTRKF